MHVQIMKKETKTRIRIGWSAFGRQHNVMKSNLPLSLKRKLYNLCILLLVSETCSLTKVLERKLQSVQRGMERIMFSITWRYRKITSWLT